MDSKFGKGRTDFQTEEEWQVRQPVKTPAAPSGPRCTTMQETRSQWSCGSCCQAVLCTLIGMDSFGCTQTPWRQVSHAVKLLLPGTHAEWARQTLSGC